LAGKVIKLLKQKTNLNYGKMLFSTRLSR
jgi:hypothetical protein